ncbi:NADH:flavin oxidoreductase/NADH oxidase [Campylobacter corcagiensis]|uniref:NADH:flavin oxidoreductase/NADH oxidase n=1 Tax=Campylobacter corcagiensis TaxID=1448857 RepID=A0A7M1LGB7_9BACT|nr:NADH:flavin oxidoreductase/NADH oxidase [Campylobacter corcagiensis]QKF64168.1 old yellow enzyme (OYE)-related FMN binding domain-containing protein [Campylobacter corcagiensis]QOQ87637.1 NADH:flavin oxidoreductase/NADH oxidase [Campylobacter corcagiensis]
MSKLLKPIKLGNLEIKNRIVMPPMCTYMAKESGKVRSFHRYHYVSRAIGGVGFIIVEATAVEERGRISNFDLGLWDDNQIKSHTKLTKDIHKFGAKVALQLAHSGRKCECVNCKSVAPSPIRFSQSYNKPKELSLKEIANVRENFLKAAKRAVLAGYDMVEIHAAHGYLLHEFLSPLTNERKDEYGSSFENRVRLLCEIMDDFSKSDISFGVRISADEWENGGFGIEDSKNLAKILESLGAKYIHVSAGGNHPKPALMPDIEPLYQANYAKEIKSVVNVPVIAVGLITTIDEGEKLLNEKYCDMVAYGRELLRNPNLALYAQAKSSSSDDIFSAYKRAF